MAKRFTDTEIWSQTWFLELSPENKIVWKYLTDKCDTAGLWPIDIVKLKRDIGFSSFSLPALLEEVNRDYDKITGNKVQRERILQVCNGKKMWITGHLMFHWCKSPEGLNTKIPAVRGALSALKMNGLHELGVTKGFITLMQGLPTPYINIYINSILKDSKDKDIRGGVGEKEKPEKHQHGEYKHVLLSDEEVSRFKKKHGSDMFNIALKLLDEGIELKGYKYTNHNLALQKWPLERAKEEHPKKNPNAEPYKP